MQFVSSTLSSAYVLEVAYSYEFKIGQIDATAMMNKYPSLVALLLVLLTEFQVCKRSCGIEEEQFNVV